MASPEVDAEKQVYESLLDVQLGRIEVELKEGPDAAGRWHVSQMDPLLQLGTKLLSPDAFETLLATVDA